MLRTLLRSTHHASGGQQDAVVLVLKREKRSILPLNPCLLPIYKYDGKAF